MGDYQISPIDLTVLPNPPESQRLVVRPQAKNRRKEVAPEG